MARSTGPMVVILAILPMIWTSVLMDLCGLIELLTLHCMVTWSNTEIYVFYHLHFFWFWQYVSLQSLFIICKCASSRSEIPLSASQDFTRERITQGTDIIYLTMPICYKILVSRSQFLILQITNTHFYETTQGSEFHWVILGDGSELGSGVLSLPQIEPQSSYTMDWKSGPWYTAWTSCTSEEIFLTVTMKLLHSTRWVEAGHVISSTQMQLPSNRKFGPHVMPLFYIGNVVFVSEVNFLSSLMAINVSIGYQT